LAQALRHRGGLRPSHKKMQLFSASVYLLGALGVQLVRTEGIIGFDGKEHDYVPHAHRDGLHDRALHQFEHPRRHDLSHPRLRRWDGSHLHHMLNQAPIIVSQHNLHIATNSHHIKSGGFGDAKLPSTLAATRGTEKDMIETVYRHTAEEDQDAAKRDQKFHFRRGHKQTEQNAAVDLTAEELQKGTRERGDKVQVKYAVGRASGPAPSGAPGPAPSPGGSPGPAPAASPAAAPYAPEGEKETNGFSTMIEHLGAHEQGFSGKLVQHDNGKTMTKDWLGEYGPGSDSHKKICQLYPDNQWCRDRGYHRSTPPPKSEAVRAPASLLIFSLLVPLLKQLAECD